MYNVQINTLKQRQEELKPLLEAKANEILKVDSGVGKQLIAELGSVFVNGLANGVGIPLKIKIPSKFYSIFLPLPIALFLIPKDAKKKKKLAEEFEALSKEYNDNVTKLAELEGKEILESLNDPTDNGGKKTDGEDGNRSAITQQQYIIFGIILLVLILLFIYWKRRQV